MPDVIFELELSVPEEVREHPTIKAWVERTNLKLDRTINEAMEYYIKTGNMVIPVPFSKEK